jgi:hypothetical protein
VGPQPGFKGGDPKPTVVIYFITPYKYSTGDFKGKRMLVNQKYVAGWGKFETVASKRTYLRRDVESILGRELNQFECKAMKLRAALDGKSCLIEIVHNEGYANIKTIMSLPEGMPGLVVEPESDPKEDYIPSWIEKLRASAVVQERADTDKIAQKGWEKGDSEPAREPTKEELDVF